MPAFEIEQYEVHAMKYRVEADDLAQAIIKLFDGESDPVADSLEYIEVDDERGLWADDHATLAEQLLSLGLPVENVIPSIRSVTQLDGSITKIEQVGELIDAMTDHAQLTDEIEWPKLN